MKYYRRNRSRGVVWAVLLAVAMLCVYAAVRMISGGIWPGSSAPKATPAPSAVTSSVNLDEFTFYAIQFGAFDNDKDARTLTNGYVSRGAAGYVLTDTRSRAIGAAYLSRSDADKVRDNLTEQGIDSYVYTVSAPRVELRVTAPKPLIESIAAAESAIIRAIDELSETSMELDRGNMTAQQAQSAITSTGAKALTAYQELYTLLEGRQHIATNGILGELKSINDACNTLLEENVDSAMEFSGKIKYNIIDMMLKHAQFMQSLIQPVASA